MNTIADLRQIIAEQDKDLACLNEEKRYFQMQLMNLERRLSNGDYVEGPEDGEECGSVEKPLDTSVHPNNFSLSMNSVSIPPTIQECDEG